MRKKPLTPEQRAALDARDRALLERFLARDPTAERELVERLNSLGKQVARHLWYRLYEQWEEFRGEYFLLLCRWREDGKLRLDEPLRFLAQRLLKQAGRKSGVEAHRDQMAMSFDESGRPPEGEPGAGPELEGDWDASDDDGQSRADWLEGQALASMAAQPRFTSPETALATKEQLQWLQAHAAQLAPGERATFEAELEVAKGVHETLQAALGTTQAAAWQRRSRLKKALRRMAEDEGADEILDWLERG